MAWILNMEKISIKHGSMKGLVSDAETENIRRSVLKLRQPGYH